MLDCANGDKEKNHEEVSAIEEKQSQEIAGPEAENSREIGKEKSRSEESGPEETHDRSQKDRAWRQHDAPKGNTTAGIVDLFPRLLGTGGRSAGPVQCRKRRFRKC